MSSNARPIASVTPRPAQSAPASPTASATVLPVSGSMSSLSCAPMTGIRASAESTMSSWSDGSSSRTNPRTDTKTSRSGNNEKKA